MYNKLFTKIIDSSIWLEPSPTRIVWVTFLAVMDEVGFVQFSAVGNVANRARVTLDEAQAAVQCLESPDPESGDPEHEGRRVERVPGGWMVLNAEKHRALVKRVTQQEQTRERVRKHRALKRTRNAQVTPSESESESESESTLRTEANVPQTSSVARAKGPPDPRVKEFLTWFRAEYPHRRQGADYLVKWAKHGALVKQMLGATDLDKLKMYARILLSDKTDEDFIVQTDRGIEILSAKFSWLSDRYAQWLARRTPPTSEVARQVEAATRQPDPRPAEH